MDLEPQVLALARARREPELREHVHPYGSNSAASDRNSPVVARARRPAGWSPSSGRSRRTGPNRRRASESGSGRLRPARTAGGATARRGPLGARRDGRHRGGPARHPPPRP
jgi:hypothetical protein